MIEGGGGGGGGGVKLDQTWFHFVKAVSTLRYAVILKTLKLKRFGKVRNGRKSHRFVFYTKL